MTTYKEKSEKLKELDAKIKELQEERQEVFDSIDADEEGLLSAVDDIQYCGESISIFIRQLLDGKTKFLADEEKDEDPKFNGKDLRGLVTEYLQPIDAAVAEIRNTLEP